MPALQRASSAQVGSAGVEYISVSLPEQRRDTRIVKNASIDEIANELVGWIRSEGSTE